jgi:hypothetical protein
MYLLLKTNKKTYCQGYCPRANLYTRVGKTSSKYSKKTPLYLIKGNMKWIMLFYFGISLFFITMSTIRVSSGLMPPMEKLRFLIFFRVPFEIIQLIEVENVLPWILHLSYRFYSMMMTTTLIGLILALVYKPKTWCVICPIATISDAYLDFNKKRKM